MANYPLINRLWHSAGIRTYIKGFNTEQQIKFVKTYFKNYISPISSQPDMDLLHLLYNDKQLTSNACNPLLLTYFCLVYEENRILHREKTLLYEEVLIVIAKRYKKKFKKDVCEEDKEKLGQIAFVGMLNRSAIREEEARLSEGQISDINFTEIKSLTENYFHSALINIIENPTAAETGIKEVIVEFYHKSIQDYLAIWWMFKHFNEKIIIDALKESNVYGIYKSFEDESKEHLKFFLLNLHYIFKWQHISYAGLFSVFSEPLAGPKTTNISNSLFDYCSKIDFQDPNAYNCLENAMIHCQDDQNFLIGIINTFNTLYYYHEKLDTSFSLKIILQLLENTRQDILIESSLDIIIHPNYIDSFKNLNRRTFGSRIHTATIEPYSKSHYYVLL